MSFSDKIGKFWYVNFSIKIRNNANILDESSNYENFNVKLQILALRATILLFYISLTFCQKNSEFNKNSVAFRTDSGKPKSETRQHEIRRKFEF